MNRIKEVLEEKGVKQIWLAKKLDKSYNMVNAYVQNRRLSISIANQFKSLNEPDNQNLKESNWEVKKKNSATHLCLNLNRYQLG